MDIKNISSLNVAQKGIYYDQMLMPNSACYTLGIVCRFASAFNDRSFQTAYMKAFDQVDKGTLDLILKGQLLASWLQTNSIEVKDLSSQNVSCAREKAELDIANRMEDSISLEKDPLLTCVVFNISEGEFWLFVSVHHIVADALGLANFVRCIARDYIHDLGNESLDSGCSRNNQQNDEKFNTGIHLAPLADEINQEDKKRYWSEQFDNYPSPTMQSLGRLTNIESITSVESIENIKSPEKNGDVRCYVLSNCIPSLLQKKLSNKGIKLRHALRLAVLMAYRSDTQKNEFAFGNVVHGREEENISRPLGMHSHILPARISIESGHSLGEVLDHISDVSRESYRNQHFPVYELARESGILNETQRVLADVMFNYIPLEISDFTAAIEANLSLPTNYFERPPLLVRLYDYGDQKEAEWVCYAKSSCFDKTQHEFFVKRIESYLQQIAECALNQTISAFERLPEEEKNYLLNIAGPNGNDEPNLNRAGSKVCIHEIFEQTVRKKPNAIAVISGEHKVSYSQLNKKANRLARYLISKGLETEAIVAIYMNRSIDMLVGILAILKAGAAYLPLDIHAPLNRLQDLVDDSNAKLLLCQKEFDETLASSIECEKVVVNCSSFIESIERFDSEDISAKEVGLDTNKLAYVIYTSGSTGKPKGVMVEHHSVVNLSDNLNRLVWNDTASNQYDCQKIWALNAPISFDSSVKGLLALFNGLSLALLSEDQRSDPEQLLRFISDNNIDFLDITPGFLAALADYIENSGHQHYCLPNLVVGGDAFDQSLIQKIYDLPIRSLGRVFNVYGPTECTVNSSIHEIKSGMPPRIGSALQQVRLYVLDQDQRLQSVGAVGELYIAGEGVARGYLNRPELNQECFVKDPFNRVSNQKMYKTGDLVRWCEDGSLAYIGREDRQVKIRGYRIELAEIETVINEHPSVASVYVDVLKEAEKNLLIAYVVFTKNDLSDSVKPDQEKIQEKVQEKMDKRSSLTEYLRNKLPEYMVPSSILCLENMPLTSSGKIAKDKLPKKEISAKLSEPAGQKTDDVKSEIETKLIEIWKNLLNLESLNVEDNFFKIGGHSLLAVRLSGKIKKEWKVNVNMRDLFRAKTIRLLANLIETRMQASVSAPGRRSNSANLTSRRKKVVVGSERNEVEL